jgi:hypothetical protein
MAGSVGDKAAAQPAATAARATDLFAGLILFPVVSVPVALFPPRTAGSCFFWYGQGPGPTGHTSDGVPGRVSVSVMATAPQRRVNDPGPAC